MFGSKKRKEEAELQEANEMTSALARIAERLSRDKAEEMDSVSVKVEFTLGELCAIATSTQTCAQMLKEWPVPSVRAINDSVMEKVRAAQEKCVEKRDKPKKKKKK